jgi:hypothetical protein
MEWLELVHLSLAVFEIDVWDSDIFLVPILMLLFQTLVFTHFNSLLPNDLQRRRTVSPLNCWMTYTETANIVS